MMIHPVAIHLMVWIYSSGFVFGFISALKLYNSLPEANWKVSGWRRIVMCVCVGLVWPVMVFYREEKTT